MKIEMALTARRTALTLAVAGALLGFAAPAASAAPAPAPAVEVEVDGKDVKDVDDVKDGPSYVIAGPGQKNGKGPIDFIVNGKGGREPIFFCDADKPKKRHSICVMPIVADSPRF